MRILLASLMCLWATMGQAQHWATADFCRAETDAPSANYFAPEGADYWQAQGDKISNSLGRFWKIEAAGKQPSYLLGTLHVPDPKVLRLPDLVADALDKSQSIHIEIDFRRNSRAAVEGRDTQSYMIGPLRRGADLSVFDTLSDGPFPKIERWVASRTDALGYGAEAATYLSTAGLAYLLLSSPCADFEWGGLPVLDQYLQIRAVIDDKIFAPLEDSVQLLADLSTQKWATAAEAMVLGYGAYLKPPAYDLERADGVALYLSGEIGTMIALDTAFLKSQFGPAKGADISRLLNAYLVAHRNLNFLETAKPYLDTGGAFIGVGAFHLPLDTGLINLLRTQGFTVTRVPLPGERTN